ncbi:rhodanese-like domain-containing protein [Limnohabitans sp. Rim11]|jgi:rhodanese-related sulfurtransferase|uniref:rhodanese-like domain-containing protein n=1 Tax=Limnohabitans sp. Rim11 TaxID=1100719 RepID=UPI000AC4F579|nr:rhodanese-like domain-containing protein [Limnohabitans sp. Rim11]
MQQVSPSQFNDWLQQAASIGQPLVLDVRETWECQLASIAPAGCEVLIMPMQTIPARLMELDKSRPIACLCHHGGRSMQVALFLEQQGFSNITNISGGIHAWSNQVDASVPVY